MSVDARFDGSGSYVSGSTLQHAIVEYAGYAGQDALQISNAAPYIADTIVRYPPDPADPGDPPPDPVPVSEPATLLLLGMGVSGLVTKHGWRGRAEL